MLSILVVDDHRLFRATLITLLERQYPEAKIYEAENGKAALLLAETVKPTICLLDLQMPVLDGWGTLQKMKDKNIPTAVIIFSQFYGPDQFQKALQNGAKGYLSKNCEPEEIFDAIESIKNENVFIDKTLAAALIKDHNEHTTDNPVNYFDPSYIHFNEEELKIIVLHCKEYSIKEKADILNLSPRTIDGIHARLADRCKVKTMIGVVFRALKQKSINLSMIGNLKDI